jgi:hypothetical protein
MAFKQQTEDDPTMIVRIGDAASTAAGEGIQAGAGFQGHAANGQLSEELLSPSIQRTTGDSVPAFELKLVIPEALAQTVEAWAVGQMERDHFCDPQSGGYQTTTLYLDTPQLDVFHRSPGFRRRKYRLRRYGDEGRIYLERKSRRGDRVRKRRSHASLGDLSLLVNQADENEWAGTWFRDRIAQHSLVPSCRVTYRRTAFVKATSQGPVRLTFDRQIRGLVETGWDLSPVESGECLLPQSVVCEFKFRESLPSLFKDVIVALQLQSGSMSKYRSLMTLQRSRQVEGGQHG